MNWFYWILLVLLALLIPTAYAGKIGAPYAPTRLNVVRRAFDQLGLDEEDVVVDLGAGDGSIVLEAAKRGSRAVGYELSPIMWLVSKLRAWRHPKAEIRFGNFYKQSLADATIIFTFLMPNNMPRVRDFLSKQKVPNGQFLFSYMFPFKDDDPITIIRAEKSGPIYVYDLQKLTQGGEESTQ